MPAAGKYFPDLATFATQARSATAVPVYRVLMGDHLTPVTAYERLARASQYAFLLESVVGGDRIARYSFLGANPRKVITAWDRRVVIQEQTLPPRELTVADPLKELETQLASIQGLVLPNMPRFLGGAVGFAGYDTVRYLEGEKLPNPPHDDRGLPDLCFGIYDDLVIFDHVNKTVIVLTNAHPQSGADTAAVYSAACQRVDGLVQTLQKAVPMELGEIDLSEELRPEFTSNVTPDAFGQAVLKAQEYIKAGDIFQVVLSQRLHTTTPARPFDIYRALRIVNPSPFMFFLQTPECILCGASPEIMCRVEEGIITNRPIAGTRKRGRNADEDAALEAELLADPKERAEHIMLVDLARNDVGRVAVKGSIQINEQMTVERYSHVMHIVSDVRGKLAPGLKAFDAMRVALPVGTVSGAPKIRAMQIIDELESTKRGPYAGAVGYVDYNGNMDTCIALRTMVITPAPGERWNVYVQAGGGVVADSTPAGEYQESMNKAAGLLKAVALAQKGFHSVV